MPAPDVPEPSTRRPALRTFWTLLPLERLPIWLSWAIAALAVLIVLSLRLATPREVQIFPFLLCFPVIIGCGAVLNHGSAYFAVLLGAVLWTVFAVTPLGPGLGERAYGIGIFLVSGLLAAWVSEGLHRAFAQLVERKNQLRDAARAFQEAERQKTVLLDELSHRVRNDLSSAVQLLRVKAKDSSDPESLRDVAGRILVLERAYEKLHDRGETATVDARRYLESLVEDFRSTRLKDKPIRLAFHADSVELPIRLATPIGLIINELVTNAAKHAFPDDRPGEISVIFHKQDGGYRLSVRDDGVGPPEPAPKSGSGSRLIQALAQQIGGEFKLEPVKPGCCATVLIVGDRPGQSIIRSDGVG